MSTVISFPDLPDSKVMMGKKMPSPLDREIFSTSFITPFTEKSIHHRTKGMSLSCFFAELVLWLSIWTILTKHNILSLSSTHGGYWERQKIFNDDNDRDDF